MMSINWNQARARGEAQVPHQKKIDAVRRMGRRDNTGARGGCRGCGVRRAGAW